MPPPLQLGQPSVLVAWLKEQQADWPRIAMDYLRMAARHLRLLLGRQHWLARAARRCCAHATLGHERCWLVQAYFRRSDGGE